MKWQTLLFWSIILFGSVGCQGKGFESLQMNATTAGSNAVVYNGPGKILLKLVTPASVNSVSGSVDVELDATPIEKMKQLTVTVNDQVVRIFKEKPLRLSLLSDVYDSVDIVVKAVSVDLNGKENYLDITLTKGKDNPADLAKGSGIVDQDCMTNDVYDACIFWKNPVAQQRVPFASPLKMGSNVSGVQTYGVKLINQTSASVLSSPSIRVSVSNGVKAQPSGGKWKFPYASDSGKSYVAQVMAYYWLTFQEKEMERRTGVFYAKGQGIPVDALDQSVPDNAYWDGSQIVMGIAQAGGANHEMAMSAEVYLHEMGHANLDYASTSGVGQDNNGTGKVCKTAQGCLYGINEGQADFHFLILFGDSTALGETWANSLSGLSSRNVKLNATKTVTQFFNASSGEIHSMGAAYAAILYAIYSNPQVDKTDFEKIFSAHLQKLNSSTRFPEARNALMAEDAAFFGGKYSDIIKEAFNSRGVTP